MKIQLKHAFNVKPEIIYKAWLDSKSHSEMTGGQAEISDILGERFSCWDGYISGNNLVLDENKKIVQTWRTTEFLDSEEDSHLEINLIELNEGTELSILHTNLPDHGDQYIEGWKEHYFKPMETYFNLVSD